MWTMCFLTEYIMWDTEEMHIKKMIKSFVYVIDKHRNIVTEEVIRVENDVKFLSMFCHRKFRPLVTVYYKRLK